MSPKQEALFLLSEMNLRFLHLTDALYDRGESWQALEITRNYYTDMFIQLRDLIYELGNEEA